MDCAFISENPNIATALAGVFVIVVIMIFAIAVSILLSIRSYR